MSPSPQTLTAGRELDGYQLIRFLGSGGFGDVWLCRSKAMGDLRALKWISSINANRLEKEHESLLHYRNAAARLRSPHLVPIEHVNRLDDGLFYVMPLADGCSDSSPEDPAWQPLSLAMKIQLQAEQPQWFSSQEISALILPVLQALQTLTDAGLVHRDVKPENILFFNGQPCLGDISLLGADASVITRRGTPGYATPSWYQGGHPDMFGAAATLYALLTGNEPDKMGRTAFLWPPQGSDALSDQERAEWQRLHQIIRRATEERVTERFIDLNSMAREIRHEPPLKPKRTRLVIAGLSIAIVSTLALIAAKRAQTEDPDPIEVITTETTTKTVEEPETEETSSEELQPEPELTEAQKNDYHALAGMIQGYIVSRDYTNALATVEELLATYSQARNQPAFSIMRAMALIGLDRIDEARKELKRDIHVSPLIAPMTTRKEIWEKLGDLEAAEHDLSRILDAHGPATFTLFLRADIRAQRGNYAGVHADRGTAHKAFTDPLQAKLVDTMWKPLETKYPGYGEFVKSLAEKSQLQD